MAAGYGAGLLWLAAAVLWWSGWREELGGDLSPRAVTLFLASWPVGWLAGKGLPADGRTLLFTLGLLASAVLLCRALDAERRFAVISAAGLAAAVLFMLIHPAVWMRGLTRLEPAWCLPVVLGGLAALTHRSAREQVAVLTLALLAVACGSRWLVPPPAAWPAPESWSDMWWLALITDRTASIALYRVPTALRHRWRGRAGHRA